jgi:hypothetical protein
VVRGVQRCAHDELRTGTIAQLEEYFHCIFKYLSIMTGFGGKDASHCSAVAGSRVVELSMTSNSLYQPKKREHYRPTDRPAGLMDASGFFVPSDRSYLLLTLS